MRGGLFIRVVGTDEISFVRRCRHDAGKPDIRSPGSITRLPLSEIPLGRKRFFKTAGPFRTGQRDRVIRDTPEDAWPQAPNSLVDRGLKR
jgi:hypothetical protein